jgi:leader peptidase (prepilin peptidase)/N-methyltransferase
MPDILILKIAAGFFGAFVGSFLNVCIVRLPAGGSIVFPRSHCPRCKHPIRSTDNIPILSYLLLKGRCRYCRAPISWRYPAVEAISAIFSLLLFYRYGPSYTYLIYYGLVCSLIVIAFIDFSHWIIPNVITIPGIIVGGVASFWILEVTPMESILGILVGGGGLYLVAFFYQLIARREGMGGGDIKLLAMLGAFIGWKGVLFTILTASATGTVAGLAMIVNQKKGVQTRVPFGPFLSLGAVFYLLLGKEVIQWYLRLRF